jgi:hypothetical protein
MVHLIVRKGILVSKEGWAKVYQHLGAYLCGYVDGLDCRYNRRKITDTEKNRPEAMGYRLRGVTNTEPVGSIEFAGDGARRRTKRRKISLEKLCGCFLK